MRVGVVKHPSEWRWCGYPELIGQRQRYRLLDVEKVLDLCGGGSSENFQSNYRKVIDEAVARGDKARQAWWTESIAVGRESFVRDIEKMTTRRVEMMVEENAPSQWTVRESKSAYSAISP